MKQPLTTPTLLNTAERRAYVLKLRKAGATYAEIADAAVVKFGRDAVNETGAEWASVYGTTDLSKAVEIAGRAVLPSGWDARYAYKDVMRELEKLRAEMAESAADVLALELERLDDLLKALWGQAARKEPDHGAIDRVLKVMKRRSDLLGLDAPQRQEVTGPDGDPLQFVIVGANPENL